MVQYGEGHDEVTLQHDNARPHDSKGSRHTFKWEVLLHLPYFPDVLLLHYHLVKSLFQDQAGLNFQSYDEVNNGIDSWIALKDRQCFPTWHL